MAKKAKIRKLPHVWLLRGMATGTNSRPALKECRAPYSAIDVKSRLTGRTRLLMLCHTV